MGSVEIKTVQLERIMLYTTERTNNYLRAHLTRKEAKICEDEDAYEFRRVFRGFGQMDRKELTCPATWWDHLKLAIRKKWPRLFGRLGVRWDSVMVETGALVDGLREKIGGRYFVIPYTMDPIGRSYSDHIKDQEE